jgi:hypothetical protein
MIYRSYCIHFFDGYKNVQLIAPISGSVLQDYRYGSADSDPEARKYWLLLDSFILIKLHCVPVMQDAVYTFMEEFVPHMEEEETTFQPLLSQYFQYEELKQLKVN